MRAVHVVLLFVFYIGYLGYQAYDFYNSPESELGQVRATVVTLKESLAAKELQVKESQEFYRTLDVKRAELRELSEKLLSMKATLSETVDIPSFMKLLITEAQRIGLQITSITPLAQTRQTYYAEQPVEIQIAGVFIQLIAYLDRISQSTRIIRVEDIALKPTASAGARPTGKYVEMVGTIKVKTFYYIITKDDDLGRANGVSAAAGGAR